MTIARVSVFLSWLVLLMAGRVAGQEPQTDSDSSGAPADQAAVAEAIAAAPATTVPTTGSQIPPDQNRCAMCHTEPALWEAASLRLYVSQETLDADVHWQKGVVCSDCHGGDPTNTNYAEAHGGLVPINQLKQRCIICHREQRLGVIKGVHAKAGEKDSRGRGLPLDCAKCHGAKTHGMLPVKDLLSPVFLHNQVAMCGSCHSEDQETYLQTVHGKGLSESGLLVTAVCANCHGAHGIYYAADRRSTLHPSNVAATCSNCHKFIEGRLAKSVHGRGSGPGFPADHHAPGGKTSRHPSCTDCHQGHHLLRSDVAEFRSDLENRCGNCHMELSSRYAMSMHGELTRHGNAAAAKCADCHGSHDILPVDNPNSTLAAGANRLRTCQKCHVYAVSNFTEFDPHANFKDAARYPKLHALYDGIRFSINFLFICYLIHAVLWFVRALVERLQHGGHTTLVSDDYALPRFETIHRATYVALSVAFVGLTATGLAFKYSNQHWGQWIAAAFGGFPSARDWHHVFAVLAIVAAAIHVAAVMLRLNTARLGRSWKETIFGPDSLFASGRDFRDLGKMLLWFVGFGRKPGFERWAYWEKLDYWALCLAAVLIGVSGLMLWYPNLFCIVLSGAILNVAKIVHSEFALYVASFLFLIHFFHAHFRPEKFPMDLSVITGMVSEQHLRKYRPDYIARLEREGKLSELREKAPSKGNLWLKIVGGVAVFTLGFFLLAITLLASLGE